MTATTHHAAGHALSSSRIVAGGVAGLAGGIVFGILMQAMGMISMVAMRVGSSSTTVGWTVHLLISLVIGAGFGVVLGGAATPPRAIALGLGYGAIWWVLGPLLLMPAKLGMPLFTVNATAGKSLLGHLMFGAVTGGVYALLQRRHA